MRHLDLLQRFPLKTIGRKNWVQKLREVVKSPNKPHQRPQIQLLEQGDMFRQNNRPVRVLRKSTNVSNLAAKAAKSRFSREHKHVILEEEENHDRTGKPVVCPQRGSRAHQFVIGDDETELDFSSGSRSFLDRVNDQVRKKGKNNLQ